MIMPWFCPVSHDELCAGFANLSSWTYEALQFGHFNNFVPREETITEVLLMDLIRKYPHRIKINKFNVHEEKNFGADWEWWFIGQSLVFRMRIQAKKLNSFSLNYDHLDYPTDKTKPRQVDALITEANKANPRRFPAYCFYNYWPANPRFAGPNCGATFPRDVIRGCSIASASKVKKLLANSKTDLANVSADSDPLICMFCPRFGNEIRMSNDDPNWLPTIIRESCLRLKEKEEVVPECSDESISTALNSLNHTENIEGLAGIAAFLQEDII